MSSYFDGKLLGTAAQTGEVQSIGKSVCLGSNDGGAMASWDGCLDEIKILTTAWTPSLVAAEYQRVAALLQHPPAASAPAHPDQ